MEMSTAEGIGSERPRKWGCREMKLSSSPPGSTCLSVIFVPQFSPDRLAVHASAAPQKAAKPVFRSGLESVPLNFKPPQE